MKGATQINTDCLNVSMLAWITWIKLKAPPDIATSMAVDGCLASSSKHAQGKFSCDLLQSEKLADYGSNVNIRPSWL